MRLLRLASLTADKAVLAATRSMDKIVITSRGSAFAAAPSDIGSEEASAASAETSTPLLFLLAVIIQIMEIISTNMPHNRQAHTIADHFSLKLEKLNMKSYQANYFAPHLFFFIFMSVKFSEFF